MSDLERRLIAALDRCFDIAEEDAGGGECFWCEGQDATHEADCAGVAVHEAAEALEAEHSGCPAEGPCLVDAATGHTTAF